MIPQPIVSRSVSRAISADVTVEERASIPCFRHQGYASASQIVSKPWRSSARAVASISSRGSIVSCMTPIRNGGATRISGERDLAQQAGGDVVDESACLERAGKKRRLTDPPHTRRHALVEVGEGQELERR